MKIGLIAMSGIRACDPELLRLGLTLPGFVERSKVIASLPSLGLLTLAGMTPRHHETQYFEVKDINSVDTLPEDFDLVAISSYSAQIDEAYTLADRIRASGAAVVMGGLHASMLPDEAAQHCTSVVIGEGELWWPAVLEDAEAKALKRFYGPLDSQFDLREAPMPAYELLQVERYNRLTVQTSRGCPHRCQFCAGTVLLTQRYVQKPERKVLNEIAKIQELWARPFIEFADDNSFVDKNYWKLLLPQLRSRHLRWFAETDLSVADDEQLLDLMYDSGCVEVLIGLESPSCVGLDNLEMNSNWKLKHSPDYRRAIRTIQEHGIRVNACFIVGLDGQGPEVFQQIAQFVREAAPFDVQITIQTAFPGTPLYRRLERDNRILEPRAWQKCTLFDINFKPSGMDTEALGRGFRDLGVLLYSEEFTAWRKNQYREDLRKRKAHLWKN